MNKLKLTLAVISTMMLGACVSDTTKEVLELQNSQEQMNQKASQDLDNVKTLEANVTKFNSMADQLQVQADAANKQVKQLSEAYAQFDNPDDNDAVAIRERNTQETQKAIDLQKQVNKYRSQADEATAQSKQLKDEAYSDANQSDELAKKIATLQSTEK